MQRAALAIVAAAAAGACRSGLAFSGLLRSAPAAAGRRSLSAADAAAPTSGDAVGVSRVSLDFNEVRLVGRVSKVLDINARNATFLLTTSHTVRRRSDTDEAGTLVQERDSHTVFGSGGQNGVNSGDANWHLHLYPGSHVEIVGSLDYRLVRIFGSDSEAKPHGTPQLAKYEPIIRLTRLTPAGGSDAFAQQQQQQHQHQHQQKPWQQRQWQPRRQQRESRRHEDSNDGDSDEGWGGPRYEANRGQEKDGY